MSKLEDLERYARAAHAMQSGVALDQGNGSDDGSPKHLRVGINSCQVNDAAMTKLLVAKGLFTEDEYCKAIADAMEEEVKRYTVLLERKLGTKITLG